VNEPLEARLERFLLARHPGAHSVEVTSLERSTEGFSQETFSFDAEIVQIDTVERRAFVAKREPVAGLLEPYDLEPEFRVLHALSDDPLPSPPTPWFERDPAVLDRPFYVMERLPGEVPVPAARPDGSGPLDDATRLALAPQVIGALTRLHAVDWQARGFDFLGVPPPGRGAAEKELARWERRVRDARLPVPPMLLEALSWLRRHLPVTDEITLVHGDYRLGNWLIERAPGGARLSGLLDWELVHLGDPLEDVAWCTSLLWRAGGPNASGLVPQDDFLARYGLASGRAADPERLRFYEVLTLVKMSAIMLTGIRAFRDGRTPDLRMAIFDHQLPFLMAGLAVVRGFLPSPG
jgi:aminoglycoside phosphotransferase (APT) family kinase protein